MPKTIEEILAEYGGDVGDVGAPTVINTQNELAKLSESELKRLRDSGALSHEEVLGVLEAKLGSRRAAELQMSIWGQGAAAPKPKGILTRKQLEDAKAQFGLGYAVVNGLLYRDQGDGTYDYSGAAPSALLPKKGKTFNLGGALDDISARRAGKTVKGKSPIFEGYTADIPEEYWPGAPGQLPFNVGLDLGSLGARNLIASADTGTGEFRGLSGYGGVGIAPLLTQAYGRATPKDPLEAAAANAALWSQRESLMAQARELGYDYNSALNFANSILRASTLSSTVPDYSSGSQGVSTGGGSNAGYVSPAPAPVIASNPPPASPPPLYDSAGNLLSGDTSGKLTAPYPTLQAEGGDNTAGAKAPAKKSASRASWEGDFEKRLKDIMKRVMTGEHEDDMDAPMMQADGATNFVGTPSYNSGKVYYDERGEPVSEAWVQSNPQAKVTGDRVVTNIPAYNTGRTYADPTGRTYSEAWVAQNLPAPAPAAPAAPVGPAGRAYDAVTGSQYLSSAERAWYTNPVGPAGRKFNEITNTPYRSDAERTWYLSQIGKGAAPSVAAAATSVDRTGYGRYSSSPEEFESSQMPPDALYLSLIARGVPAAVAREIADEANKKGRLPVTSPVLSPAKDKKTPIWLQNRGGMNMAGAGGRALPKGFNTNEEIAMVGTRTGKVYAIAGEGPDGVGGDTVPERIQVIPMPMVPLRKRR